MPYILSIRKVVLMFFNVRFYGFASFVESISKEYTKKEAKEIKEMLNDGKSFGTVLKTFPKLGYGVEYIQFSRKNGDVKRIGYINVGETYTPTLIRVRGNVRFLSVGDVVEMMERRGWRAE
jgi:hypothetical protein